jgi:hypothetical protein
MSIAKSCKSWRTGRFELIKPSKSRHVQHVAAFVLLEIATRDRHGSLKIARMLVRLDHGLR